MAISTTRQFPRRYASALALALIACAGCNNVTGPQERLLTLQVASTRVPCTGSFPTTCLQTRERSDAPWELFYDPIAGFTYEPNYEYVLRVTRRDVPNPPADGSAFEYRLVAVLSKIAVP